MITVRVKVLGALEKPSGKDDFECQIAEGSCLEDLMLRAGYRPGHLRFILPSVAGVQQPLGYRLSDRDEVVLFMPTSGG